ncbi:YciI family protein [Dyadobacter aurulentus]|uniref:YciI family protein n=1 Tax=Dyadobacter sp. UC 10 TaxID=2605428 RepID=UPI0011F21007|nr:YciI family protein [Dyadobacter sp. UC 10]KAA0993574.1 transcription initiation protein [Dyadobacter sp. UC 10]
MDEYLILMRLDLLTREAQPSPEEMQGYMKMYNDWVGGIAAQDKFVGGKGLSTEGKVLKPGDVVTDGPFVEIKESLAGFIIVKAGSLEEATKMAAGCPILLGEGNSVEVRKIAAVHEK